MQAAESFTEKTGEIIPREEVTALQAITKGEVDMQVATAKKFPRSIAKFRQDALTMATLDQETAEACFYVLKRGGKAIEGPGVRLAEIVASCWGNLRCEARVIDEDGRFVTAQGTAWDMERNVLVRTEVRRRITDKEGRTYSDDMITVTANAASSIAFRNAVFKVVPSAYTKSIYEQARAVAIGNERTLADRRERAFAYFAKAGVTTDRVLALLGKKALEDVGLDDLATLQGIRTAIQENTTTVDEAFPPEALKEGTHGFGFKKGAKPEEKPAANVVHEPPPARAEQHSAPAAENDAEGMPAWDGPPADQAKSDGKSREQREAEWKAKRQHRREPGEEG